MFHIYNILSDLSLLFTYTTHILSEDAFIMYCVIYIITNGRVIISIYIFKTNITSRSYFLVFWIEFLSNIYTLFITTCLVMVFTIMVHTFTTFLSYITNTCMLQWKTVLMIDFTYTYVILFLCYTWFPVIFTNTFMMLFR